MTATLKPPRLFTLRLWQEDLREGSIEWRGKVQALPDGEAYYFRGWAGLVGRLEALLASEQTDVAYSDTQEGDVS